jgi:BMFP domain-containing protein YqiC
MRAPGAPRGYCAGRPGAPHRVGGALGAVREFAMPQTRGRLFDDLSRLMTDAAGLAEGAKREVETLARAQLERLMAGMDLVSREEFEAVREMAALARTQNDKLEARIAALEAKLAAASSSQP